MTREIRYIGGVATVSTRGELNHTHSPRPMQAMLAELAETGEPPPDLVVADHGWAGAAGQAGITAVGFADSNDPALFVGEAEGKVAVAVPLDDNVAPHLYAPLTAYLLHAAGLAPAEASRPRLLDQHRAQAYDNRPAGSPERVIEPAADEPTLSGDGRHRRAGGGGACVGCPAAALRGRQPHARRVARLA